MYLRLLMILAVGRSLPPGNQRLMHMQRDRGRALDAAEIDPARILEDRVGPISNHLFDQKFRPRDIGKTVYGFGKCFHE